MISAAVAATDTDPVGMAEALVGLPVATVVVAVTISVAFALQRRWLVLGRELDELDETCRQAREALVASHSTQLLALEAAHAREIQAVTDTLEAAREDRALWRATSVRALNLGEAAVSSSSTDG